MAGHVDWTFLTLGPRLFPGSLMTPSKSMFSHSHHLIYPPHLLPSSLIRRGGIVVCFVHICPMPSCQNSAYYISTLHSRHARNICLVKYSPGNLLIQWIASKVPPIYFFFELFIWKNLKTSRKVAIIWWIQRMPIYHLPRFTYYFFILPRCCIICPIYLS